MRLLPLRAPSILAPSLTRLTGLGAPHHERLGRAPAIPTHFLGVGGWERKCSTTSLAEAILVVLLVEDLAIQIPSPVG